MIHDALRFPKTAGRLCFARCSSLAIFLLIRDVTLYRSVVFSPLFKRGDNADLLYTARYVTGMSYKL